MSRAEKKELFDRMTLNCLSHLESFEICKLSEFHCDEGALTHELLMWDKKNVPFKLPKDLKSFYSVFNGVNISWTVQLKEKFVTVGEINLNRIELFQRLNPIEGVFQCNPRADISISQPDVKSCAAFLLHSASDVGDIYLLYRQPQPKPGAEKATESEYIGLINQSGLYENPEVWLLDISQRWHFIAQTFTQYFRLLVCHLGIRGWQLALTPEGLPNTAKHWMGLLCKERLLVDLQHHEKLASSSSPPGRGGGGGCGGGFFNHGHGHGSSTASAAGGSASNRNERNIAAIAGVTLS